MRIIIVKILNTFFSIWVFFHDHSQIIRLQEKWEGISLTPRYHFHSLHRHLDIIRAIILKAHICTKVAAGLEPGTFGFREQVANH